MEVEEMTAWPDVEFVSDLRMRGHVTVHDSDSDHDGRAEISTAGDSQNDSTKRYTVDSRNTCDSRDVAGSTSDKVDTQHENFSSLRGADNSVRTTAHSTPDNKSIAGTPGRSCDTDRNGCNDDVKSRDTSSAAVAGGIPCNADTLGNTASNSHDTRNDTPDDGLGEISMDDAQNEQDTVGPRSSSPLRGVVFALSGYQNPTRAALRDAGLRLGAHYQREWTPRCTHLVRTRTRRVSVRQLDILWEFLNSNRDIANSFNRSLTAKEYSQKMWRKIAVVLNSQDGVRKDWRGWSKYWVDYKAKLKVKVAALRSAQQQNGGGPIDKNLTEIDEKFLPILERNVGQGLSRFSVELIVEPQDSEILEKKLDVMDVQDIPSPNTCVQDIPSTNTCVQDIPSPNTCVQDIPSTNTCMQDIPSTNTCVQDIPSPNTCVQDIPSLNTCVQDIPLSTTQDVHRPNTPAHSPATQHCSPRRHRRRDPAMSQEAARRALVHSSQLRADAAIRSSEALERMAQSLEQIKNSTERIERVLNFVLPRVAGLENGE